LYEVKIPFKSSCKAYAIYRLRSPGQYTSKTLGGVYESALHLNSEATPDQLGRPGRVLPRALSMAIRKMTNEGVQSVLENGKSAKIGKLV
jgi:hypothetical protein